MPQETQSQDSEPPLKSCLLLLKAAVNWIQDIDNLEKIFSAQIKRR